MEMDRKIIVLISSIAVLLLIAYASQALFSPGKGRIEAKIFSVNKGETVKEIAFNLKNEKLIDNPYAFIFYTGLIGKYSKLQAGEYLLSSQMSVSGIVNSLAKGETVKEKITILEGWDLRDLAGYFQAKGMSPENDFYSLAGIPAEKKTNQNVEKLASRFDFLEDKPEGLSLEGYLFPDTYYVGENDDIETIIEKALTNFDRRLTGELRDEIKNQNKTVFEIITMASMIEKEVKTMEDKRTISGILWKRLKNGVGLQVDATVLYASGKENSKVYIKDTQYDSLYNTYKYRGLPLGPISNPGIDSIMAAIYPDETDYWYYLSSPAGKTIFSKTLEEHNYNKAKYLQ